MTNEPPPTPSTPPSPGQPTPAQPAQVALPPQLLAQILASQAGPGALIAMQTSLSLWQGQFPPPEAIERYEAVLQGTFDRIIHMAERRLEAEIANQDAGMVAQKADVRRGHYLGAGVTALAVTGALVCVYLKSNGVAVALVAVPVMSVARSLIETWQANRQAVITTPAPAANTPSTDAKPDAPAPPQ